MTVAAAWVRQFRSTQELVFVSDSRLSGDGRTLDASPKILMLPRTDCAIAFAGYTGDAYPIVHHLTFAIDAHRGLASRTLDLTEFLHHLLNVMNETIATIGTNVDELSRPDVAFLFGGYSWRQRGFRLWKFRYEAAAGRFLASDAPNAQSNVGARKVFFGSSPSAGSIVNHSFGSILFAGDQGEEAKRRFSALLQSRLHYTEAALASTRLNYEPFEVVRDMLREQDHAPTIGGSPQMLKVYQHLNTASFAVYWPDRATGRPHLAGRPLLGYERIDRWFFDPDTLRSRNDAYSTDD